MEIVVHRKFEVGVRFAGEFVVIIFISSIEIFVEIGVDVTSLRAN